MHGIDLKDWRHQHNYTQEALALELEITRQTVIGWEKGIELLPRILVLALESLSRSGSITGRRATASEQKMMRTRPHEPGSKVGRVR